VKKQIAGISVNAMPEITIVVGKPKTLIDAKNGCFEPS